MDAGVYVSHEGVMLDYESAMTREVAGKFYNLSTHFLWIGGRLSKLGSAHVEYCRGVENPVGMKIGPDTDPEELLAVMHRLNPKGESGKLVLIPRIGLSRIKAVLPRLAQAAHTSAIPHIWLVDPMHGNSVKMPDGIKTRSVTDVTGEVLATQQILLSNGEHLSGLHLESAFENVTECIGLGVAEDDLCTNYTSLCGARLNLVQMEEVLSRAGVGWVGLD